MTPDRLSVQPWMRDPATLSVLDALAQAGGAGRFVGGCVRNALIGRPIDDIDICTPLTPDRVMAALKAAGLKFAPTGVEHGTVTAIAKGRPFEVTTLRRDVQTDGRRAVVAFTTDWAEDAERRDFRLNALYLATDGRLHDPIGCGIQDALAGRIVFVGDPEARIREDYLRILRFFRFRAWYGRGPADPAALAACRDLKAGLAQLSAERVSKELLKLLAAADPLPSMRLMAEAGVLQAVAPGFDDLGRLARLLGIDPSPDPELRLAALWSGDPAAVTREADRLRLSKAQRERLAEAARPEPALTAGMSPAAARRLFYRMGQAVARDRVRLAWAGAAPGEDDDWARLADQADRFVSPRLPITGQDAANAGLAPGPAMGAALREAEAWWVEQDFAPDRQALIHRLATGR